MKEEFLKIILITGLIIVFNAIPTSAITSPEDYLYEYNYTSEKTYIETIYFDGTILYLFVYCTSECTIVVFDPENMVPYFDKNKLIEIFKNLETKNYIKAKNIKPDLYDNVINDLGVDGATTCRVFDYTDVVKDTAIIQTENVIINYLPNNDRQKALYIAAVINKAADVRKYSVPIVTLSVACWGEDIVLSEFTTNGKTAKESIINLNKNIFLTGQPDTLFSSHKRFVLSLRTQKFSPKTIENTILTIIKNLLGGDEELIITKINKWHDKTSIYFKPEELNIINSKATENSNKSITRLEKLKKEVSENITSLSEEIQSEITKRKNKLPYSLLFDFNYTLADNRLLIAKNFLKDAKTSFQAYRYNTAKQLLQKGYSALAEAKSARQKAENTKPTLWKLGVWILVIFGSLYFKKLKFAALVIFLLILIIV